MKKNIIFLSLIFLLLAVSQNAFGAEFNPAKLIFKDPAAIVKINLAPLIASSKNTFLGPFKKAQTEMYSEIERRTGLLFERDIKEAGLSIGADINFAEKDPNNFLLYVTGNFNSEKIFAEIEKENNPKLKIEKKGDVKVLIFEKNNIMCAFLNNEAVVIAPEKIIDDLLAGKFQSYEMADSMKSDYNEAMCYINVFFSKKIKEQIEINAGKLPPIVTNYIKNAENVIFLDKFPSMIIKAAFSNASTAEEFKKIIENGKGMAELFLTAKEKEEDEKIKNASTFNLLNPEFLGIKTGIALAKIVLNSIKTTVDKNTAELRFIIPDEYKQFIKPEFLPAFVAATGIIAAIAVPNFTRARNKAIEKSCRMNMMTIEGACELYMMENSTPASITTDELVTKKYLKNIPLCPIDKKTNYTIIFKNNLTDVKCENHGLLSEMK